MGHMRRGFTMVWLLLTIAIFAILAAIVIVAVSPLRQFTKAEDARRQYHARQIENAAEQFLSTHHRLPGDDIIPEGQQNAFPICRAGFVEPNGCISMDELIERQEDFLP